MIREIYDDLNYIAIELGADDSMELWDTEEIKYARVSVPTEQTVICRKMHSYRMVDRTLEVRVSLNKNIDFLKQVRVKIEKSDEYFEDVRRIALNCFKQDYRFRVKYIGDCKTQYVAIIDRWLKKLEHVFVCKYKGMIVGFANVIMCENNTIPFIHLAAVEEKYRMAGAALSLYSYICHYYKQKGFKAVKGRISCSNIAVMNLYISLGGKFSNPCDIYLKEGKWREDEY